VGKLRLDGTLVPERIAGLSGRALAAGEACQKAMNLLDDQERRRLLVSLLSAEINHAALRDNFTDVLETVIASLTLTAIAEAGGLLAGAIREEGSLLQ
jgi:hypothetical protein